MRDWECISMRMCVCVWCIFKITLKSPTNCGSQLDPRQREYICLHTSIHANRTLEAPRNCVECVYRGMYVLDVKLLSHFCAEQQKNNWCIQRRVYLMYLYLLIQIVTQLLTLNFWIFTAFQAFAFKKTTNSNVIVMIIFHHAALEVLPSCRAHCDSRPLGIIYVGTPRSV